MNHPPSRLWNEPSATLTALGFVGDGAFEAELSARPFSLSGSVGSAGAEEMDHEHMLGAVEAMTLHQRHLEEQLNERIPLSVARWHAHVHRPMIKSTPNPKFGKRRGQQWPCIRGPSCQGANRSRVRIGASTACLANSG
jgi:hypothetical protein